MLQRNVLLSDENIKTIFDIIDIEWNFFGEVEGLNGRAQCQDDKVTFYIMRFSQHQSLSEVFFRAYLEDLLLAKKIGRNLIAEKYAWMMERTDPAYFATVLRSSLPELTLLQEETIKSIMLVMEEFQKSFWCENPAFQKITRPHQDTRTETSALTYIQGELKTYGQDSLNAFLECIQEQKLQNQNIIEKIISVSRSFVGRENEIFKLRPLL